MDPEFELKWQKGKDKDLLALLFIYKFNVSDFGTLFLFSYLSCGLSRVKII